MKYFKFIGKSKKWGWAENPENGKTYSLKQFCEMYGPAQWNGGENLTQNQMLTQIIQRDSCWQEVPKPKKSLSEKIEKLKKQAEKEGMAISFHFEGVDDSGLDVTFNGVCLTISPKPDPYKGIIYQRNTAGGTFTATNLKDEWEGCYFGKWDKETTQFFMHGKTYLFDETYTKTFSETGNDHWLNFTWISENFKPSTESAYVEQLKAKAKELFGEIKEGDRFDTTQINKAWSLNTAVNGGIFEYEKRSDRLYVGSKSEKTCIYEAGKWAKKLPKRIEVPEAAIEAIDEWIGNDDNFPYEKWIELEGTLSIDKAKFLASQLEKYLNGEIE